MSEPLTPEQRANGVAIDYTTGLSRIALARDIAAAIRAAEQDQRERDAKIVEGWHIKKGGYMELAAAIRSPSQEPTR